MEAEIITQDQAERMHVANLEKCKFNDPDCMQAELDKNPTHVEKHKETNKEYVPISYIERDLDELFLGLWSHKDFKFEFQDLGYKDRKGNATPFIVVSIEVSVFRPDWEATITRTGVASGFLYKSKANFTISALKAEAFKNAIKSLGKKFGRDLNRNLVEYLSIEFALDHWAEKIKAAESVEDLKAIQKEVNEQTRRDPDFRKMLNERFKEFK